MKHFLLKIIENPTPKDPAHSCPDVHKHFTRYSRGLFDGPIAKLTQSAGKITLLCSYEYEDEALRITSDILHDSELSIMGAIIGGEDFSPLIQKLELVKAFYPSKSTGQTSNYSTVLKKPAPISLSALRTLAIEGTNYVYFLLSLTSVDKSIELKTKPKPPRPSSKTPEESSSEGKMKFCSLKMPNTQESNERVLHGFVLDFLDEIPSQWKSITIQNSYEIKDLVLPDKNTVKDSRDIRLMTLRKGVLHREIEINKSIYKKDIEFIV